MAGFTGIDDDLVHGFGGGYRLPVVPAIGREAPVPGLTLEAGLTLVVQRNVVTPTAGPASRPENCSW